MSRSEAMLTAKSAEFLAAARKDLGVDGLRSIPAITGEPAAEIERVAIQDPTHLTADEVKALAERFHGRFGMVAFECLRTEADGEHPLVQIGSQLRDVLPCKWPISSMSDEADGTTKIRNIESEEHLSRSMTNLGMAAHQDGWLSLRGVPAVTGLWVDSGPVERAATYSQNIFRVALDLWRTDEEAFGRLFADDAVTIIDKSGGTVAVSPVLFVEKGNTRTFFREPNEEYAVASGADDESGRRAIDFLIAHTSFQANGSTFTYLDRPGRGLLLNNRHCVHGRTAFVDGATPQQQRILASKWWVCDEEYRNVRWN